MNRSAHNVDARENAKVAMYGAPHRLRLTWLVVKYWRMP
jgi:hypothetical protein